MTSPNGILEESKDQGAYLRFSAGWLFEFKPQKVMLAKLIKSEKKGCGVAY